MSPTREEVEEGVVQREPAGRAPDGSPVELFTLRRGALAVRVTTWGGIILSIHAPDRDGEVDDVVLGHDAPAAYRGDGAYLGAVVGRYANRIAHACFALDGRQHVLSRNDGEHHLHGGAAGLARVNWRGTPLRDAGSVGVWLEHTSPDGDEGYPGTLAVEVRYRVFDGGRLVIDYRATTDRPTHVNLTQHSYFNLAGSAGHDVLGHELTIVAERFTPVRAGLLPTGALAPVEGTPLDFRAPRAIGERIGAPCAQLGLAGGYDHNFVLAAAPGPDGLRKAARLVDPGSGRTLDVHTTEPGLQLYSGNFLDGTTAGKGGRVHGRHGGVCLETQHFPDSPNQPAFPSTILRPGGRFASRTIYTFGVLGDPPRPMPPSPRA
ncbi:MAG TPA: aldose epimerase family protein [Gemmatimonadaceae bacterium]|nr:aldose epimerase family protein [Gemmatimonadaceae bacterium]